jgi:hypothetical protein
VSCAASVCGERSVYGERDRCDRETQRRQPRTVDAHASCETRHATSLVGTPRPAPARCDHGGCAGPLRAHRSRSNLRTGRNRGLDLGARGAGPDGRRSDCSVLRSRARVWRSIVDCGMRAISVYNITVLVKLLLISRCRHTGWLNHYPVEGHHR